MSVNGQIAEAAVPEDFRHARRRESEISNLRSEMPEGHRLPPHSEEAERGVLGSCLLDSAPATLLRCRRQINDDGMQFYLLQNRVIWVALCALANAGMPSNDVITLQQHLRDYGHLQEAGGVAYLASLPDAVPSAANVGYYLDILREKFVLRRFIGTCTEAVGTLYEFEGTVEQVLENHRHDLEQLHEALRDPAERGRRLKKPIEFADDYWAHWFGGMKEEPGLDLPESCFGAFPFKIRTRELTFVLGEKGAGKTNLMCYLALHLAAQGMKCAIAAMEEHPATTLKILSSQLLGTRKLPDNEWGQGQARGAFEWLQARVRIYDFMGIAPWRELLAELEDAAAEGTKLFIVDSVMRLGILDDDYAEQGKCASHLARFCMEADAHLLLVNHLNKGDKSRGSQQWIDNAHNRLAIRRNEKRAGCLHELLTERDAGRLPQDKFLDELAKLNEHESTKWSSKFELLNQRWPGSQQNASRYLLFNRDSLQLHDHRWTDPAVDWLEKWKPKTQDVKRET